MNEFRDLRANPRCLLESQILSFRARFARMVSQTGLSYPARPTPRPSRATPLAFSLGLSFDPYDSTHLPRRVFAVGAASHFPSVVNLLGDVFDAPVFVPSTVLDAAQIAPAQGSPPQGIPSRAALGSAYLARWAWRRVARPDERHSTFEDEVRWLLGKRWAAQQTQSTGSVGSTPTTPRFGPSATKHLASASARSGLAATAFVEEDEEDVARFQSTGEVPMSSVFKYPPEADNAPRVRTLTGTSTSSATTNGTSNSNSMGTPGAPSTAFTTPDLMAPSPNALSPNGSSSSAALTPIAALQTDDADAQFGLVKVAEPDSDAFMAYAAMVPEYCRLETLIIKGLV